MKKMFLRKENPWGKPRIFKTIEIGTHSEAETLRHAVESFGARVSTWAGDILAETPLGQSKQLLNLVTATVAELGYPNGTQLRNVFKAGLARGWELCPAEVGPQLRLQYPDQPDNEWLVIAMEPLRDSDGVPSLFDVYCHGGTRWLSANYGKPDDFWHASDRFVFVSRK
ncbi:hypothetical protein KJ664_01970 [Patescibacteria group bacterium]|nr:hypothetical protein [Patescibacteria group bacterium]